MTDCGHSRWTAKVFSLTASLAFLLTLSACQKPPENPAPQRLAPVKAEPAEVSRPAQTRKEEEPQVKVKRDKDGRYSWEIDGKDVTKILQTDRRLRRSLKDGLINGE